MRDLRVSFPKPCEEKWDAMTPVAGGCDRVCAACDKVIHDLSHYDFAEVEALLRADPDTCVRARIDADGTVALRPGRGGRVRRMVVAAASVSLLAACAPALAEQDRPAGEIRGKVEIDGSQMRVTATAADGRTFRTKARYDGQYRIRKLPAGTYTLTFESNCSDSWTVADVVVGSDQTVLPYAENPAPCIIVGQMMIDERNA